MIEPAASATYRLFLAISLPEGVVSKIEEIQRLLRRAVGRAQVSWTNREQLHLTIKFLGNVPAVRCQALQAAITKTCASFPPLRLTAGHIGFFPNSQKPRVIWVGVEDSGALLPRLHAEIERDAAAFSTEEPEGRFQAHVTLARVKQIRREEAENLAHASINFGADDLGSWTASRLDLIRSQLSSEGARYSIMGIAAFSAITPP
jgi:2'-5' RNA ligase